MDSMENPSSDSANTEKQNNQPQDSPPPPPLNPNHSSENNIYPSQDQAIIVSPPPSPNAPNDNQSLEIDPSGSDSDDDDDDDDDSGSSSSSYSSVISFDDDLEDETPPTVLGPCSDALPVRSTSENPPLPLGVDGCLNGFGVGSGPYQNKQRPSFNAFGLRTGPYPDERSSQLGLRSPITQPNMVVRGGYYKQHLGVQTRSMIHKPSYYNGLLRMPGCYYDVGNSSGWCTSSPRLSLYDCIDQIPSRKAAASGNAGSMNATTSRNSETDDDEEK